MIKSAIMPNSNHPIKLAMILAAGRGERMRPLTDHTPKPLLRVDGRSLIEFLIERLADQGIRDLIINHSWLGEQIPAALGDGKRLGVRIRYLAEPPGALETGGGICNALPLLCPEGADTPFLVVNGDLWIEDLKLRRLADQMRPEDLAFLLLVDNPPHHGRGDFLLEQDRVRNLAAASDDRRTPPPSLTFSGLGLYRSALFDGCEPGRFPLAPLLRAAAAQDRVGGMRHAGSWFDIGTPQRLMELDARLSGAGARA